MKSDAPVYQETYYADAPITTRIISTTTPVTIGVLIALACFLIGWYARGILGVVWDNRGWAVLLMFSVAGSAYMINACNRRSR